MSGEVLTWLSAHSLPIDSAASVLKERQKSVSGVALLPLMSKPLVETDSGTYACTSIELLSNAFGNGFFFRLFDYFRQSDQQLKFTRLFGAFLGDDTLRLVRYAVRNTAVRVFGEVQYRDAKKESRSTDIVIVDGADAVFIDVR